MASALSDRRRPGRASPRRGSRTRPLARRPPPGRRRDGLGGLHVRLPGHGHRDGQAHRGRGPRCRTTWSTWWTRTRSSRVQPVPAGRPRRPGRHRRSGPPGAAGRGHRPLPPRRGRRPGFPGRYPGGGRGPGGRAGRRAGRGVRRPARPAWPCSTRWRPARIEPTNRRRVVRALEVTIGSGRPFSSFGPGLEAYPPTPVTLVGLAVTRRGGRPPHRGAASA